MSKQLNLRNREVRIWFSNSNQIQWKGKKVKPSELALMGTILQYAAIGELGGLGIERKVSARQLRKVIEKGKAKKHLWVK